jgi:lipopolysaccharide/colanic/teichoic acid biosynthesis glycosyltransferase
VLVVLSPFLILIAVVIKLDSRGPVFYRQDRAGRNGHSFRILKFRSMTVGAEHVGSKMKVERNDARITRVGAPLRRTSLDEIPQLFNVLSGAMSLVGPRPGLPYQAEQYTETQRRRLLVGPGITGWAQVNGRNALDWGQRIELDLEYVDALSFGMDLRILLRTIPAVLSGSGMIAEREYFGGAPGAARRDPSTASPATEREEPEREARR